MMARIRTRTINARRQERLLWRKRLFASFWEFILGSDMAQHVKIRGWDIRLAQDETELYVTQ